MENLYLVKYFQLTTVVNQGSTTIKPNYTNAILWMDDPHPQNWRSRHFVINNSGKIPKLIWSDINDDYCEIECGLDLSLRHPDCLYVSSTKFRNIIAEEDDFIKLGSYIDDVKEKLTDGEYKQIIEEVASLRRQFDVTP